MPQSPPLIEYDPDLDVLEVFWGESPSTHGDEIRPAAVLRFTDDNELVGLTLYAAARAYGFDPAQGVDAQAALAVARVLADYHRSRAA